MPQIVILLSIILLALVNCQNALTNSTNGTSIATTVNLTTTLAPVTNKTTIAPNTTTTLAPVTTTAAPVTTSVTPTMPPSPERWTGNVTQDYTCIIAQFAVQITIKYNNTNHTEVTTGFDIPVNATVDESNSFCTNNVTHEEQLTITFSNEETSANLTLVFNNTSDAVLVEEVSLSYILTKQLFPGFHDHTQYNKIVKNHGKGVNLFKVAKVHSYVCEAAQTASLEESTSGVTNGAEVHFSNSKVEAYISQSQKGYDTEINCKSTEVSDVVPIAVGAALAGLVVIVLIAYFIGRRRSRRLAYQSV